MHSTTAQGLQLACMAANACKARWQLLQQPLVRPGAVQPCSNVRIFAALCAACTRAPAMTLHVLAQPGLPSQDMYQSVHLPLNVPQCAAQAALVMQLPVFQVL